MPLPAALAARLAKRGIIKDQPAPPQPKLAEEVEEVFAEDYDDPSKPEVLPPPQPTTTETLPEENSNKVNNDSEYIHEVLACPNRSNPYHKCVVYCKNRWGLKTFTPDPKMIKRRDRMLRKYPLPEGWKEVADPDTGRYFYWSMHTDQVCWLSPGHPNAVISMPTQKLSGTVASLEDQELEDQEMEEMANEEEEEAMEEESDTISSSSESESDDEIKYRSRREPDRGRGHGRDDRDRRRGRNRRDDLDPMDPAAYSDIPRGGWTDGLDTRGSAKTGVDVTASGPLFQQRPYPSPGDILRANQTLRKK